MRRTRYNLIRRLLNLGLVFALLLYASPKVMAQPPVQSYKVKDGKMFIVLDRRLDDAALDNFIAKYDLYDLPLKEIMRGKLIDSLLRMGWYIEKGDPELLVISKRLESSGKVNNAADKIIFSDKNRSIAERFPAVSHNVKYGYNRFRNKYPFAVKDSMVTFFLRNNQNARKVMLAGSFNDWQPDVLAMTKTDSGWIARVKLGAGKYWYKFIIDGRWTTDRDNLLEENDGLGNMNSVYYKTNWLFTLKLAGKETKAYVSGSFNKWEPRELPMTWNNNQWVLPVYLLQGTHTYRFVADGNWFVDPTNPDRFPNEFNEYNSVIRIGSPFLFRLNGYENAKKVILSGSFNDWKEYELFMRKTNGGWELPYTLGPGNYEYKFIVDGKSSADPNNPEIRGIKGHSGNSFFTIGANYSFRLKGYANAKTVFLSGDFNNWSPNTFAMKKDGNDWILKVHLFPGKHLYKFVVDGNWIIDPSNQDWEQDEQDNGNSVLWFGKIREPD